MQPSESKPVPVSEEALFVSRLLQAPRVRVSPEAIAVARFLTKNRTGIEKTLADK